MGNTAIATYLEKASKKSSDNNNILTLIYLWLTHFQSSYIVFFKNAFFEGGIFNLGSLQYKMLGNMYQLLATILNAAQTAEPNSNGLNVCFFTKHDAK